MKKDIVIGLGEIGMPIYKKLSKFLPVEGLDKNKNLMNEKKNKSLNSHQVDFIHICIPYNKKFEKIIFEYDKRFNPTAVVIHSTTKPNTTNHIQKKLSTPVIYSPIRGVHSRMSTDLKRYGKFFAIDNSHPNSKKISNQYQKKMAKLGIKTRKISNPLTLELSKIIVDTSYYGWLINYAQISKIIADKFNVDYDEMWTFSDEIHKFLKNRPKMFPGFIGGHCVIPNLELIDDLSLNQISKINLYFKKMKKK